MFVLFNTTLNNKKKNHNQAAIAAITIVKDSAVSRCRGGTSLKSKGNSASLLLE